MLRMTGSAVEVNGVRVADAVPPGVRLLPWERRGRIDVEALVSWAYFDQRACGAADGLNALEAVAAGLEWQNWSTCGCVRAEKIGQIGRQVDVSPGRSLSDVHPVAEAVVACVETSADKALLLPWARSGARPGGWAVPARWVEPVNGWVDGQRFHEATQIYEQVTGAAGGGRRCLPIEFRDPALVVAEVAARRAVYGQWWAAVEALAFDLSLRNLGFMVEGPASPRAPWDATSAGLAVPEEPAVPGNGAVLWVARWDALSRRMVAALGENAGRVTVIEVDDAPALAGKLGVRAVPTAMVLRNGRAVVTTVGMQNERAFVRWLQRADVVGA